MNACWRKFLFEYLNTQRRPVINKRLQVRPLLISEGQSLIFVARYFFSSYHMSLM